MRKKNKKRERDRSRKKVIEIPLPGKNYGMSKGNRILLIILLIIISFLALVMFLNLFEAEKIVLIKSEPTIEYYHPKFVSFENSTYISMYLPAVDENGQGIITTLGVEAVPGSGRILVDIENLVFWDDTQSSIRTAREVVEKITKKNMSDYDLIYTIYTDANMVGGPSAGSAIVIATIAVINNQTLNENVMITGAINSDGTIGKVTAIKAKAEAAKQINITNFLVPPGQTKETYYEIKKSCNKIGLAETCTIEQIPKERDISEQIGITLTEVSTIEEAMKYFF